MSTGAECNFWETEQGEWYYRLQHWPYGDNDEFSKYGPFSSFAAAKRDLSRHPNPGGYSVDAKTLKGKEEAYGWPGGVKPEWPDWSQDRKGECLKCGAAPGTTDETCPQCEIRIEYLTKDDIAEIEAMVKKFPFGDTRELLEKVVRVGTNHRRRPR